MAPFPMKKTKQSPLFIQPARSNFGPIVDDGLQKKLHDICTTFFSFSFNTFFISYYT